jgi:hypothetical protein
MEDNAMNDKLEPKIVQGLEALEAGQTLEQVLKLFPASGGIKWIWGEKKIKQT